MIAYSDAILSLVPQAQFSIIENKYETLQWLCELPVPTENEIQEEVARLQNEEALREYARLRSSSYPSIEDQLDMLYWDKMNGTNNWEESITRVKGQYPKP